MSCRRGNERVCIRPYQFLFIHLILLSLIYYRSPSSAIFKLLLAIFKKYRSTRKKFEFGTMLRRQPTQIELKEEDMAEVYSCL